MARSPVPAVRQMMKVWNAQATANMPPSSLPPPIAHDQNGNRVVQTVASRNAIAAVKELVERGRGLPAPE